MHKLLMVVEVFNACMFPIYVITLLNMRRVVKKVETVGDKMDTLVKTFTK